MISYLTSADMSIIAFIGVIFAFALTCIAIAKLNKFLPKDLGRQFAVDESFQPESREEPVLSLSLRL